MSNYDSAKAVDIADARDAVIEAARELLKDVCLDDRETTVGRIERAVQALEDAETEQ